MLTHALNRKLIASIPCSIKLRNAASRSQSMLSITVTMNGNFARDFVKEFRIYGSAITAVIGSIFYAARQLVIKEDLRPLDEKLTKMDNRLIKVEGDLKTMSDQLKEITDIIKHK